jgi:hypothetical protein
VTSTAPDRAQALTLATRSGRILLLAVVAESVGVGGTERLAASVVLADRNLRIGSPEATQAVRGTVRAYRECRRHPETKTELGPGRDGPAPA